MEITNLSPFVGIAVSLITNWLRHSGKFKLVPENDKARVKALAVVLSSVSAFILAYATGSYDENVVRGLAESVLAAFQVWGVSAGVHHWILRKKSEKPIP